MAKLFFRSFRSFSVFVIVGFTVAFAQSSKRIVEANMVFAARRLFAGTHKRNPALIDGGDCLPFLMTLSQKRRQPVCTLARANECVPISSDLIEKCFSRGRPQGGWQPALPGNEF